MIIKPFEQPIYVTRPILPDLERLNRRLKDIWQCQQLTNMGEQHKQLEIKLKDHLEVSEILLINNATTALIIAFKALDLSGEVITTPLTFPATVHALTWVGLEPVFCDINRSTLNIDTDKVERLITDRTSAILAVHLFGIPSDLEKLERIASKYGLKLIYDAAHAFGVKQNGRSILDFGDISVLSFHATKILHTLEGGGIISRHKSIIESVSLLRNFGIKQAEDIRLPGINGKMNEIQAAIGLETLSLVEKEMKNRKNIFKIYTDELKKVPGISLPEIPADIDWNYSYFSIRINETVAGISRDKLFLKLNEYNIFPSKYFFPLCSEYPHYRRLESARRDNLSVAHEVARELMSLPFYGGLNKADVVKICQIIKQTIGQK